MDRGRRKREGVEGGRGEGEGGGWVGGSGRRREGERARGSEVQRGRGGGVIYSLSCNPAPPRSHVNCREGEAPELKIDILELLDWRSLRPACARNGIRSTFQINFGANILQGLMNDDAFITNVFDAPV